MSGIYKVTIRIEPREDGGIMLWSPDVPELVLSHSDPELVMADVAPALEIILGEKFGHPVRVEPLRTLAAGADAAAPEYAALAA